MLVVNATADIRTWIYKYKVSAEAMADNENAIRMTFPMNGLEVVAVLSKMKRNGRGYKRVLDVYAVNTNQYGIGTPGDCILAASYTYDEHKMLTSRSIIIPSANYWKEKTKNTAKNIMEAASNMLSAVRFLTYASNSKKLAAKLNITVLDSNSDCWGIMQASGIKSKEIPLELEMTELYKTFERFWDTPIDTDEDWEEDYEP